MPSSSTNRPRAAWNAVSASACRPQRYSASICNSTGRSLNGCAMTSLQLDQKLSVTAQLEVEFDPVDDRGEALLLQPRALSHEQIVRAHSPERRAAPDTQRLLDPLTSDSRLAVCARPTCPLERLLPAIDITLAGSHDQQIAARLTDQPAGVGGPPRPAACAAARHALAGRRAHAREGPHPKVRR